MTVSLAEFKENVDKYIKIAETENVYITNGNNIVIKLTNSKNDAKKILESLVGIIPNDITLEEAKDERLSKI